MRDSIYTIPVSEVFEPKDGCPICRMRDVLESRCVEYIMGAAMMEPDVRAATNEEGFCAAHLGMMMKCRNRLSLALTLETRLDTLDEKLRKGELDGEKRGRKDKPLRKSCYVCNKIDWAIDRMLATTVQLWAKEEAFQKLFSEQPQLCIEHYTSLTRAAAENLPRKSREAFVKAAREVTIKGLDPLRADVKHFTKMFDYRNAGPNGDWGTSRDSIERAVQFLTTRDLSSHREEKK